MRILVLSNAAAARARRQVVALREALPEAARAGLAVCHYVTEGPGPVAALIGHDRWRPDDLLVVNGGDGTVQHALTLLLGHCPADRLPRVACLPGGTTNMTAFDLNRHRRFRECLATLRQAVTGAVPEAPRPLVRVRADGAGVRAVPGVPAGAAACGLFFGIGSIVEGIEYFQARIRHNGGGHELGAGLALLRSLWGIARRQPPFDRPLIVQIAAAMPDAHASHGEAFRFGSANEPPSEVGPRVAGSAADPPGRAITTRLLLATTLDRLFLGIRPYWGAGPGPLKSTLVEGRAPGFVTRVPRLLRGRPDRRMTPRCGYHSARLDSLTLSFSGSYTLDGELFASTGASMRVSTTEPVRFLRL